MVKFYEENEDLGFGFTDAMDIKDKEYEWVIKDFLPKGFGYISGLPKVGNSPHGGKSILSRLIALSLVNGKPLFGEYEVVEKGDILMINLDEMHSAIKKSLLDLSGSKLVPGLKVCNACNIDLLKEINKLEYDVQKYNPKVIFIDPLLRVVGGKDINSNSTTGSLIDELRRIQREYNLTIIVIHHCPKKEESKLMGTIDIDSSWDFLLSLKYAKSKFDGNTIKCDYRYKAQNIIQYKAEKSDSGDIIGLQLVEVSTDHSKDDLIAQVLLKQKKTTVHMLKEQTGIPESTIKRRLNNLHGKGKVKKIAKEGNADVWAINNN